MKTHKLSMVIGERRDNGNPEVIKIGEAGEMLEAFAAQTGLEHSEIYFVRGVSPFKRKRFPGEVIPKAPISEIPPMQTVSEIQPLPETEEEGAGDADENEAPKRRGRKRAGDVVGG